MTHRRTRLSVLGALALGASLMITSCGRGSAATAPALPNPPPSVAPATVGAASNSAAGNSAASNSAAGNSAASNSAAPVAASTELSTAVTEAAVGGTPDATEVNSVPAAVGATEACSLVTEQEAAAALGADPGPGIQTALEGTATACTYRAGGSTLQFTLTLSDGKATYDEEHAHIPSAAASLISDMTGIGDNAFGQFQGPRGAINFDKGDALVVMGLNLAGATDPPRDQLTVLATAAAARI